MTSSISKINFATDFPQINKIYEVALAEYSSTIKSVDQSSDRLQLGVCIQILKSIYNHLTSLKLLLENCYIYSGGAVATSLWEKSILLQYLLIDKEPRINSYVTHDTFKKLPWNVREMVKGIVETEVIPVGKSQIDMIDLFYLQYSYLCAIKHGNPYTLTYLNRLTEDENFFQPSPAISPIDKDIIGFLFIVSNTTLIETLKCFSKHFCFPEQHDRLRLLDKEITKSMKEIKLNIPQIIKTSSNDFRQEFWDYLVELDKKYIS